jgi:cell division protein FtsQ
VRAAAATLRTLPRVALALPPRLRRHLLIAGVVLAVLSLVYLAWFRNSSLVRVEKVSVTGLTTDRAPEIRAELIRAARGMTTLHVDEGALRSAVSAEPVVRSITVEPDFPHGLRIDVTENVPRAFLLGAGRRVAVAGNGTVLSGQRVDNALPTIRLADPPSRGRVGNPSAAALVEVAGQAPLAILSRVSRITREPGKGIVAVMRRGPAIWFGDTSQLDAKWADAVAILADRESQGATYVDVRMPDRPVAGGLHIDVAPPPSGDPAAPPSAAPPAAGGPTTPQTTTPAGPGPGAAAAPPASAATAPQGTAATPARP